MDITFARSMSSVRTSTIREIPKVTEQPGIISSAGGPPASELFPVAEILSATSVFWARTALPIRCNTE
jgi:2-aminoadipate transaminase